jgi:hypothetical protein
MNSEKSKTVKDTIKEEALNLDDPASEIKVKLDLLECSYLLKAMKYYQNNIDEVVETHLDEVFKDKEKTDGADRKKISILMKLGGIASINCVRNKISTKADKKGWFNDD